MTGGSFTTADVVAKQPAGSRSNGSQKIQWRRSVAKSAFDDTLIERDWVAPLFSCKDGKTSSKAQRTDDYDECVDVCDSE